ncbi:MAG: DUF4197 domain-containing protein [Pseudomonadota bacterium]|nr:DUF4197 domain-containing protein [Pseudomonadota bacterium]
MTQRAYAVGLLAILGLTGCNTLDPQQTAPWINMGAQVLGAAGYGQQGQVAVAIQETLSLSNQRATTTLAQSGAFGLQFPQSVQPVVGILKQIGFASQINRVEQAMNRGAEQAVQQARPVFEQAIRQMSIVDAVGIVTGGQTSATQYFRGRTEASLRQRYQPIVQQQLQTTGFYDQYRALQRAVNQLPAAQRPNVDLEAYIINQSLDRLFQEIGQEEMKIRRDPVGRGSELIGRVFGQGR